MLRAGAPAAGEALRFTGPAFWVPWRRPELDLVFLDRRGLVVAAVARLRSWRAAGPFDGAVEGVVLAAGTCERVPIHAGDRLEFTPTTGERIAAGAKPPAIF
jgi:uncharacterized membrane protein (UPF0127 family)